MSVLEHVGSLAIICGVFATLTGIADLALTAKQKTRLRLSFENAWYWLEEQRSQHFWRPLLTPRTLAIAPIVAGIIGLGIAGSVFFYAASIFGSTSDGEILHWLAGVGLGFGAISAAGFVAAIVYMKDVFRRAAAWVVERRSVPAVLVRSLVPPVMAAVAFRLVYNIAVTVNGIDRVLGGPLNAVWVVASSAVFVIGIFAATLSVIVSFSLLWVCSAMIVWFTLWLLQLAVLRIASHPSGPVVALGALLAGVGGILKFVA